MSYAGPIPRDNRAPSLESASAPESPNRSALRPLTSKPQLGASGRRETAAIFAAGIAVGVAIGASAALLFAPQSGLDTRQAIVRKGRRFGRHSRDTWDDLRDELRRVAHRGRRAIVRR